MKHQKAKALLKKKQASDAAYLQIEEEIVDLQNRIDLLDVDQVDEEEARVAELQAQLEASLAALSAAREASAGASQWRTAYAARARQLSNARSKLPKFDVDEVSEAQKVVEEVRCREEERIVAIERLTKALMVQMAPKVAEAAQAGKRLFPKTFTFEGWCRKCARETLEANAQHWVDVATPVETCPVLPGEENVVIKGASVGCSENLVK